MGVAGAVGLAERDGDWAELPRTGCGAFCDWALPGTLPALARTQFRAPPFQQQAELHRAHLKGPPLCRLLCNHSRGNGCSLGLSFARLGLVLPQRLLREQQLLAAKDVAMAKNVRVPLCRGRECSCSARVPSTLAEALAWRGRGRCSLGVADPSGLAKALGRRGRRCWNWNPSILHKHLFETHTQRECSSCK